MNCHDCRQEVLLAFGLQSESELSESVRDHVESCAECRAFFREQQELAAMMPAETDFHLSDEELSASLAAVEERLDSESTGGWITDISRRIARVPVWSRALPVAASIVLVFLMGVLTQKSFGPSLTVVNEVTVSSADPLYIYSDIDLDSYGDYAAEAMNWSLSSQYQTTATDQVVEDISDEEYEYLVNNLDVGDIL